MGLIDELHRFRVVDGHVHNMNAFRDTACLVDYLDRYRAAGMVVSNVAGDAYPAPEQVAANNEATARLRDAVGERIIPFCYANAQHTEHAMGQIATWSAHGFKGLKFLVSQRATDPRAWAVTEAAIEKGWPILYHGYYRTHGEAGDSSESTPTEIAELARRYPQGSFIMAHMGAQFEHGLRAVADCLNVAVDYAGSINEKGAYEMGVSLLGPDRVVFGTALPGACFYTNAGRVLELDASDTVKQQIFAGNILRLIGR